MQQPCLTLWVCLLPRFHVTQISLCPGSDPSEAHHALSIFSDFSDTFIRLMFWSSALCLGPFYPQQHSQILKRSLKMMLDQPGKVSKCTVRHLRQKRFLVVPIVDSIQNEVYIYKSQLKFLDFLVSLPLMLSKGI